MQVQSDSRLATPIQVSTTRQITEHVRGLNYDRLPAPVVEVAKHCFLDWLGVTIAGSRESAVEILRAEALMQGGALQSSLIGTGEKASYTWAALINGTASHALDFDDVVAAMSGHPSVPVFPALLALAEHDQVGGRAFITAFVAGFEVECRVGTLMAPGHYARGFHATGTVGTFGAAAACAHVAGLDADCWTTAFGLAGTQAAGLKSMFGTMAKPFHAGKAAANGLLAARLAAAGFTAHPDVLEVEQGFADAMTDTFDADAALSGLGETFGITSVLFKYHAACYLTHASIEALKRIKSENDLAPELIEAVCLRVPPGHLKVCNIHNPITGLEGKFSLRFTAALALVSDDTSDRVFTDERVRNPFLEALRDKVTVEPTDGLPTNHSTDVEVTLRSGDVLYASADVSRPAASGDLAQQWARLTEKFKALVQPRLGADRTAQLIDRVRRLEMVDDIGHITALAKFDSEE